MQINCMHYFLWSESWLPSTFCTGVDNVVKKLFLLVQGQGFRFGHLALRGTATSAFSVHVEPMVANVNSLCLSKCFHSMYHHLLIPHTHCVYAFLHPSLSPMSVTPHTPLTNDTTPPTLSTVRQFADICLFSTAQYKCAVADLESE